MSSPMAKGLILVTMEPPAPLEDEFNDWYDTEHFPQRRALPGFETASRWVCLSGWPRWIALYDIASVEAVDTPEYRAVSGANGTPWSRRILPRTIGRERIVARQVAPGSAVTRADGVARLVVARYPVVSDATALTNLGGEAAGIAGLLQWRAFAADGSAETWVLAEYDRPFGADRYLDAFATLGNAAARLVNVYAPYWRNPS